jgi:hypothetical protein
MTGVLVVASLGCPDRTQIKLLTDAHNILITHLCICIIFFETVDSCASLFGTDSCTTSCIEEGCLLVWLSAMSDWLGCNIRLPMK